MLRVYSTAIDKLNLTQKQSTEVDNNRVFTNGQWERLEQIVEWSKLKTPNALANRIGLKRSENLYQIKLGNNGISRSLVLKITAVFPEICKTWLMFGEGEMLKGESPELTLIPKVPVQYSDGSVPMTSGELNYDIAVKAVDDSLAPIIPVGSTLLLQGVEISEVVSGAKYLFVTEDTTLLREVHGIEKTDSTSYVILKTLNPITHTSINAKDIKELYYVKMMIKIF